MDQKAQWLQSGKASHGGQSGCKQVHLQGPEGVVDPVENCGTKLPVCPVSDRPGLHVCYQVLRSRYVLGCQYDVPLKGP